MRKSLFDSESERLLYRRLARRWSRYVDVYPHIPVRNALGYSAIQGMPTSEREKQYLFRTEFDFVVCERDSSVPQLAIEFDGIGHGFSRDGSYVSVATPIADPHRKLKLDAKLQACESLAFPLVVVSFPEIQPLWEKEDALMILDAIVGEVLASVRTHEEVMRRMDEVSKTITEDSSGETSGWVLWDIEMSNQLEHNPIRRRTVELRKLLPISAGSSVQFLRDREGYVGARFTINGGFHLEGEVTRIQELLSVTVYLRDLNCSGCSSASLLEAVGEYCLARKAYHELGTAPEPWKRLLEVTPWVER